MASSIFLFAVILVLLVAGLCDAANYNILDFGLAKKHEAWMAEHSRTYKDDVERAYRFEVFKKNLKFIEEFNNAGQYNYTVGLNEFSDMTEEEFSSIYRGGFMPLEHDSVEAKYEFEAPHNVSALPSSIDWRTYGAVSPVQQQGQCLSCWAFATAAVVEGINKIRKGRLYTLSQQQLVDCDGSNGGCNRGYMLRAFEYVYQNGGLTTASNYPYKATQYNCNNAKASQIVAGIYQYFRVYRNENSLMQVVARQPVAVAIDSSSQSFQYYRGGIYRGPCGYNLDHAVTVVGYGEENGEKYWIVKNSWGTRWGENGYVRMAMGVGNVGLCGIAMDASYATV